jgi:uncharacterized protein
MTRALSRAAGALLAAAALAAASLSAAEDRPTFAVGSASAGRGHRGNGYLDVPAGSDAGTRIPVMVFHGAWPGPVLAIVAGAHGTEYASIVAVERVAQRLDPADLSGTVILLPLVNLASFERKVPHVNPVDGKSMNRFYPGRADGTQSERVALAITRDVVERSDYLIDLHGGDLDESLRPYAYWMKTGNDTLDAASRNMVLAFGLDHILVATDRPKDPAASRYLDSTGATRGKPSITAEAGHAGTVEPEDVDALVNGTFSVMRHLKMLAGASTPIEHPVWIDNVRSVVSEQTGIFAPLVKRGAYVEQGAKLGTVIDYFGNVVFEPRAPIAGIVLYVCAVPSMRKGDTVANIGAPMAKAP